jgi:mono/diheme cytochrome c family protein
MRLSVFVSLLAVAACTTEPRPAPAPPSRAAPTAAEAEAAAKGLTIAEKWCTDCHRVRPEQRAVRRPEMGAPDFAAVAARPEANSAYLGRFMEVQHLPMPTFRLYSDEKADVVAYILSLKPAR